MSILRIEPVRAGRDDAPYECVAENGVADAVSAEATLTVYEGTYTAETDTWSRCCCPLRSGDKGRRERLLKIPGSTEDWTLMTNYRITVSGEGGYCALVRSGGDSAFQLDAEGAFTYP